MQKKQLKNKYKIKLLITSILSLIIISNIYSSFKMFKLRKKLRVKIKNNEKIEIQIDKIQQTNDKLNKNNKQLENTINSQKKKIQEQQKYIQNVNKKVSYNPYNISIPSGATDIHMKRALKNTPMEELSNYFVKAEQIYGINAYFLAGLVATESTWNTSYRAINQNNLTGYTVYTSASRGSYFNTKEECIMNTAKTLKQQYLNENGEYFNGKSIWAINTKYSQKGNKVNGRWAKIINEIAYNFIKKTNEF